MQRTLIWTKSKSTLDRKENYFYAPCLLMQCLNIACLLTVACWLMNILYSNTVCLFSWAKYDQGNLLWHNLLFILHAKGVTITISIAHTCWTIRRVIRSPKFILRIMIYYFKSYDMLKRHELLLFYLDVHGVDQNRDWGWAFWLWQVNNHLNNCNETLATSHITLTLWWRAWHRRAPLAFDEDA